MEGVHEHPAYPVRIEGELEPDLSRWLWLVKWLLAIPHYIVLVFLWLTLLVLTVVAFFAILFTGRYPRGIFDFNVGVMRWTWRVAFYSYAHSARTAIRRSRSTAPDYPARLHVEYPERLSRGLVLVKWWLLAIPHYIIVGLFLGGGSYAASRVDERVWSVGFETGLIGCSCSSQGSPSSSRHAIREGSSTSCSGSTAGSLGSAPTSSSCATSIRRSASIRVALRTASGRRRGDERARCRSCSSGPGEKHGGRASDRRRHLAGIIALGLLGWLRARRRRSDTA